MTILEFIRKNSILVIIVIVAVGAGLVMMDYADKASPLARDFYIKVDGTGYSAAETVNLGENGKEFVLSLLRSTSQLTEQFDANEDGQLDEQEAAAQQAWLEAHPDVAEFYSRLHQLYNAWSYGASHQDYVNVAVNRAIIHAAADKLGLHPSEQQVDDYLRSMPPFKQEDGSFNLELYQRLTGFRRGNVNRVQEENFRGVIADMIIWESLKAIAGAGVSYNTKAQLAQIDAALQSISGRTAWLPTEAAPTPAEPTEEELRAYWEEHKENYKSAEQRIVSVYTLSPAADSNMEGLLTTADILMQELSLANGKGLDKLLEDASNNPEYDPFTYKQEDGSSHRTYELATQAGLAETLKEEVNYNGVDTPLAEVAFAEVPDAPKVEDFRAAAESGDPDKLVSIKQIRGPYTTKDNTVKLMRVDAIMPPTVLAYEEARDRALEDFRTERAANALQIAADKLYADMQATAAEQGMAAAFAKAKEMGAQVENYGPQRLGRIADSPLPTGVSDANLLSTPSGKLAPLVVLPSGARITSVDKRTVEDTPALTMQKRLFVLPDENERLRLYLTQDWLNAAYVQYNVQLSTSAVGNNTNED